MKKPVKLLSFTASLMISCSEECKEFQEFTPKSGIRTINEAYKFALKSIEFIDGEFSSKSSQSRRIVDYNAYSCPTKSMSTDTLFYVFNFNDSLGFSIISANSSIEPIIAVTEQGYFEAGKQSGIPAFDEYMSNITEELSLLSTYELEPYYYYDNYSVGETRAPLLGEIRWGQTDIYGQFCPNGIAGCFVTALCQIFAKHKYPYSIVASCDMNLAIPEGTLIYLNWEKITSHLNTHTSNQSCDAYHHQISALMRDIGCVAGTEYLSNSSGTNPNCLPEVLEHYGYRCDSSGCVPANISCIKASINNGCPVFMFGYLSGNGGHGWVADGYKDIIYYQDKYEKAYGNGDYVLTQHTITNESHCLHINWGWDGNCNGYFNFNNYCTSMSVSYDTEVNNKHYNFCRNINMLCNIRPN